MDILGVKIDNLTKNQVCKKLEKFILDSKQHYIVTPNPEFIVQASKDLNFKNILNQADLAIPDGIGLKFTCWLNGKNIHRITGADLVIDILELAERKKLKIAIINWKYGLSKKEDISKALKNNYNKLEFIIQNTDKKFINLEKFQPDILFAALGAPKQEKFIFNNLKKMPSVKLAIGVGGAFDFISGRAKRAPIIMRKIGLEWLWRLIRQPWRAKRIFNAVIIFPYLAIKHRFFK